MPNKRRPLTGMGADAFFNSPTTTTDITVPELDSKTVEPSDSPTPPNDYVVKTSFYPRTDQLDKLDDLAGEYNKKYRRQRKKIDRQDIVRFLIDKCNLDTLTDLQL